jgi:alkylation response protein AidB-like acyl-CoA dehydrogenase
MDLDLNQDQQAIQDAVEALLAKHAGPERAVELQVDDAYDHALHQALEEAGFLEIGLVDGAGWLEAVLVVEAVARAAGTVSIGASAVVAPALLARVPRGAVALAGGEEGELIRHAVQASCALLDGGEEAILVPLEGSPATPVATNYVVPMGRLPGSLPEGERLGPGSGELLRRFWRLAIAAECVGAMRAALDLTVEYVTNRRQFGRPVGSFQALQHRLAECEVLVQGGRWLTLRAAHRAASAEDAALAAAHTAGTALRVFNEMHQMTGAMGFTREHPLHIWTTRLHVLRHELGGARLHRQAAARARWLHHTTQGVGRGN